MYINAFEESDATVAQCSAELDKLGQFIEESVSARRGDELLNVAPEDVDYIDLTPRQVVSASTALIPFLEHDDANRALMGCNMQRQAVPLLHPQTALVATGMEVDVARDSGHQVRALSDGTVTSVTSERIDVTPDGGGETQSHDLLNAVRSNAFTWIGQTPLVEKFQRVKAGQPIADGPASKEGELALGQRVLVAYMSWGGYNYEDAIIVSERVVREGKFRSRILKKFRLDAMDTPLGPEVITRNVPDVADWRRNLLDEDGIAPVGSYVRAGADSGREGHAEARAGGASGQGAHSGGETPFHDTRRDFGQHALPGQLACASERSAGARGEREDSPQGRRQLKPQGRFLQAVTLALRSRLRERVTFSPATRCRAVTETRAASRLSCHRRTCRFCRTERRWMSSYLPSVCRRG